MIKLLIRYYILCREHKKYRKLFMKECSKPNLNINTAIAYDSAQRRIENLFVIKK